MSKKHFEIWEKRILLKIFLEIFLFNWFCYFQLIPLFFVDFSHFNSISIVSIPYLFHFNFVFDLSKFSNICSFKWRWKKKTRKIRFNTELIRCMSSGTCFHVAFELVYLLFYRRVRSIAQNSETFTEIRCWHMFWYTFTNCCFFALFQMSSS